MSTALGRLGRSPRLRGVLPFAVLALALVLAALLAGRPPDTGVPLDPRSTGPFGTKALVDVLDELGAEVRVAEGLPDDGDGVALLLDDQLDDEQRDALLAWVAEGNRLVVADRFSPLQPEQVDVVSLGLATPSLAPGDCPLDALEPVGRITAPAGTVHEVPDGAVGCYPRNGGWWLVAREEGEGTVVSLGGPQTFTNVELGRADNALLAASLLLPPEDGAVAVLDAPPPAAAEAGLLDLIPTGVKLAIVQLLVAFGVVVLWRARRLGRPVVEPSPVEVPGSELVVARGNLLQAAGAPGHAAAFLRDDARRMLTERLGLVPAASPETIADAAAARTGAERAQVLAVLTGEDGQVGDAGLVALCQAIEEVRRATLSASPARATHAHPAEAHPREEEGAPLVL